MYKIWIINRQSCCFAEIPELHIELRNSGQTRAARCKVYNWKIQLKRLIICEPTFMATSLTIFAKGADTLTLCEVLVTSAGIHMILNFTIIEIVMVSQVRRENLVLQGCLLMQWKLFTQSQYRRTLFTLFLILLPQGVFIRIEMKWSTGIITIRHY